MKAWQITAFGGPEGLALREVAQPVPGPGEVLVRITHCGVNPIDRSLVSGRFPWLALPHTPGSEIVGRVEALGPAVGTAAPPVGTAVALAFRLFCGRCYYCLRGREEACIADPRGANAPVGLGTTTPGGYTEYVARTGQEAPGLRN